MADAQQVYERLRNMALNATDVSAAGVAVAGVVVDIPAERGFASVSSLGDGTTSLYTSTGGGTIGCRNLRPRRASHQNLLTAAQQGDLRSVEGLLQYGARRLLSPRMPNRGKSPIRQHHLRHHKQPAGGPG